MNRHLLQRKIGIVAAAVVLLMALVASQVPGVMAQGQATTISATFYGNYDFTFEGRGAWVGYAIFDFGGESPVTAKLVDRNTSKGRNKNGSIYGTETISLTFTDGSGTLELPCRFDGTPAATPGLYTLHEVCSLANGTGKYQNVAGQVVNHGPFLLPSIVPDAPGWIAEMHGFQTGLD